MLTDVLKVFNHSDMVKTGMYILKYDIKSSMFKFLFFEPQKKFYFMFRY